MNDVGDEGGPDDINGFQISLADRQSIREPDSSSRSYIKNTSMT